MSVSALGNLEKKNAQLPDYGCDNDTLTLTLTVYLCVNYQKKKKNHSMSERGRRRKELLYIKKTLDPIDLRVERSVKTQN